MAKWSPRKEKFSKSDCLKKVSTWIWLRLKLYPTKLHYFQLDYYLSPLQTCYHLSTLNVDATAHTLNDFFMLGLELMVVALSHSVLSGSLWPYGLQCAKLPCPSLSPGVCSWCGMNKCLYKGHTKQIPRKWITNNVLLYTIWNSAQYYVAALMREEFGGEWIHVHVWLSPFAVHLKLSQYHSSALLQHKIKTFFNKKIDTQIAKAKSYCWLPPGLNVCVSPKFICWIPNPYCDGI